MSLINKTTQNIALALYCATASLFSPGVSRAYYAAYQHAKSYLISKGVTEPNYQQMAANWGVDFQKVKNPVPFGHETIWQVLKLCLKTKGQGTALKASTGERLRDMRITADYKDEEHLKEDLDWSIRFAQGFIQNLK